MNPEQGITLEGIEIAIQLDVVVIGELARALAPRRFSFVHRFPFQLHLHRQEVAVGGDQGADPGGLEILQFLLHQVEDDIGARLAPFRGLQAEIRGAIATPAHGLALAFGTEAHELYLGSHHEA